MGPRALLMGPSGLLMGASGVLLWHNRLLWDLVES